MSKKWEQLIEDAIFGKVVTALNGDYYVEVRDDGGDVFVYACRAENRTYDRFVRLTPGNGVNLITDYHPKLHDLLVPVFTFVQAWQDDD